jgi:hypothetical protein
MALTMAAAAAAASQAAVLTALFAVRVIFPVVLLAIALSLYTLKASATPASETPIVAVTVAVTTPRRQLILSILSLVALTYFLDGFALILHSVLSKTWQGTPSENWWKGLWSGLEVEALAGLLAAGLLAVISVWKEVQGVPVWLKLRPRIWSVVALAGTIAEVALLGLALRQIHERECWNCCYSQPSGIEHLTNCATLIDNPNSAFLLIFGINRAHRNPRAPPSDASTHSDLAPLHIPHRALAPTHSTLPGVGVSPRALCLRSRSSAEGRWHHQCPAEVYGNIWPVTTRRGSGDA